MATMNRTVLLLLACAFFVSGCAQTYVITLKNRERIQTKGKPRLVNGFYVYKDPFGRQGAQQAILVREIAPASMATDDTAAFKPVSSR